MKTTNKGALALRRIRLRDECTQAVYAQKIGISLHYVSRLELGLAHPSPELAGRLSTMFQVPKCAWSQEIPAATPQRGRPKKKEGK